MRVILFMLLMGALSPWHGRGADRPGAEPKPGLVAEVFDGQHTGLFVMSTPNFRLAPEESLHPQVHPAFSAKWTGFIDIPRAARYQFHGSKVLVNGQEAVRQGIELKAGRVPIVIEFNRDQPGPARLHLMWESEFFPREPVPARVLTHDRVPLAAVATVTAAAGSQLIRDHSCVACHQTESPLIRHWSAPSLTGVGARLKTGWMYQWLRNPRQYRSSARMPVVLHNPQECADVTAYLATLTAGAPSQDAAGDLTFSDSSVFVTKGEALFSEIGCIACHNPPENDLKGIGSKMSGPALVTYLMDPLQIHPAGRMPNMNLSLDEAHALAAFLVPNRNGIFESASPQGDAARGRTLVQTRGCLNCHKLEENGKALVTQLQARPLEELKSNRGCLASGSDPSSPSFGFSPREVSQIRAFIRRPDSVVAPLHDHNRAVRELQCQACHEIDEPALHTFATQWKPPSLADAGNRLRPEWLEQVLLHGKRARPWMKLRMPHFSPDRVAPLVHSFGARAGVDPQGGAATTGPRPGEIAAGAVLLGRGEGGLACINCHDFRGQPSGGQMRGPDLVDMHERLHADWMERWLRDPARVHPGTAMPAFFTQMPKTEADEKIHLIVKALGAGPGLPELDGLTLDETDYIIPVTDEPVLIRTFVEGASPRSIAVGLPGGFSYVFDAEVCRIRFVWKGPFLNVAPVWTDRGGSKATILGEKVLTTADRIPLHLGDATVEPELTFRGYRIDGGTPEFIYNVNDKLFWERIQPLPDGKGIELRVRYPRNAGKIIYRPFQGDRVDVETEPPMNEEGVIEFEPEGQGMILINYRIKEG